MSDTITSPHQADAIAASVTRRNYTLGVANGFLYITAETVMDPTLVMVAFLSHLTDSPLLLGLVLPIRDGAWSLPQLWVSGFLQSMPRKVDFYRKISYLRIATWVVVALAMNFVREPGLALALFFGAFVVSSFASGLGGLPFLEVVGKVIPSEQRGEFFAWRFGLGGLGSIAASGFVRWVLDAGSPLEFPHNYGILAVIFLVLGTISVMAFNSIREQPDLVLQPRQNLSVQLKRSLEVTRQNARYRAFLVLELMLMLAGSATPFFAVYVQQRLGGSAAMIGIYLGVWTATNLLSNAYFGRIARRVGVQKVMLAAAGAGVLLSALVLLLTLLAGPLHIPPRIAEIWLIPVFVLVGIRGSGIGVSSNSLMLDIAPEAERSLYLGFTNTLMGAVLLLTGISGVVVELFGFQTLVVVTLIAHALALYAGRQVMRRG